MVVNFQLLWGASEPDLQVVNCLQIESPVGWDWLRMVTESRCSKPETQTLNPKVNPTLAGKGSRKK